MQPLAIVMWFVCLSASLIVTAMSPAKIAEPIEVPFRVWVLGSKEPRVRFGPGSSCGKGYFGPYLSMPRLASGRYSQLYSLVGSTAASRYQRTVGLLFGIPYFYWVAQ